MDGTADFNSSCKVCLLIELLVIAKVRARCRVDVVSLALTEALLHRTHAISIRSSGLLLRGNVGLDAIQLEEHGLDLHIVVFPQVAYLRLQLIDFLVLLLLPFDENNAVVERLLVQVVLVVLSKDFDLAAEVVVRAFDELELAKLSVALVILPLNLLAALIVAVDDFPEASLVVRLQVFAYYRSLAAVILVVNLAEIAGYFVRLNFPSF